jgi:hypothetical protein
MDILRQNSRNCLIYLALVLQCPALTQLLLRCRWAEVLRLLSVGNEIRTIQPAETLFQQLLNHLPSISSGFDGPSTS